jgi:hypothetical protein
VVETANDTPIGVHIKSSDVAIGGGGRKRRRVIFLTETFTSTRPVGELLGYSASRLYVLMQAGGANVVIADKASAQNPANQVSGLPNPQGMVLPYTNTAPTRIPGGQELWAAAAAYPAQVTMAVVYEVDA